MIKKLFSLFRGRVKNATWDDFLAMKKKCLYAGRITRASEFVGYFGLNPFVTASNNISHDLKNPLPIPDNIVDVYQSEDVFEHLPFEIMVNVLNDIYRVLKPGGLFRLSVPDYRFDVYQKRSLKTPDGDIYFDPGGGGSFENGKVINGGHLWFPTYEIINSLIEKSNFSHSKVEFLHYNTSENSITKNVDYSLGTILRTPDNDLRAKNPYRAMSIIVDMRK